MVRFALAALSGVLYFVGFAGFDMWPVAFIAFVPVLWALDPAHETASLRARQVFGLGFVFGLVMNIGGYYWIASTLRRFSGFSYVWCVLLASILWAYQGLALALFALLYRKARTLGAGNLLAASGAICLAEWVFPELFQHYFGAALHNTPVAIQVADLGGPLLISGLLTAANVGIYELSLFFGRRTLNRRSVSIAAALWAASLAYGAYRISDIDEVASIAPKIRVGLVQTNMGLTQKRDDPNEGLRRHLEQSVGLEREHKLDLLVWPESAFGWFLPSSVKNVSELVFQGQIHTPTLFGGLSRRNRDGKLAAFNTAFMVDAEGAIIGTYDKTYLLAFGEYLPFGERFPALYRLSPNSGRFIPGEHVQPLSVGPYRVSVLICYEDILPSFVAEAVRVGKPHLLVNITNDAWFGDTHQPWQHLALAKLRAVEHHRALVRSTNSGVSAIVDPVGRMLATSGVYTRENLSADVPMLDREFPYVVLGNFPGYLTLLTFAALAYRERKARRAA